jgi:hypothetical protein
LYLLCAPLEDVVLTEASRMKLDRINPVVNEEIHSGERATSYDRAHRYDEEELFGGSDALPS